MGRPMTIDSPEEMWDLFEEYIKHTNANPWIIKKPITSGELAGTVMEIETQVPYTWSGFAVYVREAGYVTRLDEYKSNRKGGYGIFSDTIAHIAEFMYSQKFNGATVGAFNQSIISADLGLIQKTATEVINKTDEIDYDALSESALEEVQNARRKTTE